MSDKEARQKMFAGHFANIKRLAAEKKLVLAGPLMAVNDIHAKIDKQAGKN
jgi:uncharacterized protein YciI